MEAAAVVVSEASAADKKERKESSRGCEDGRRTDRGGIHTFIAKVLAPSLPPSHKSEL